MDLLHADLRCIDAYAHLGNWALEDRSHIAQKRALMHYQVGVAIAERTLGQAFDGILPWGCINNRPFLRCLHGYALALWRLEQQAAVLRGLTP
jgi:hypothetical protein